MSLTLYLRLAMAVGTCVLSWRLMVGSWSSHHYNEAGALGLALTAPFLVELSARIAKRVWDGER